ncbi:uncharacterized protein ATNIH1004_009370 [Aspergillus tanneri]|uniref:Uncharacterized protein n=1 Tax=Aspergillus tanneri TaxID=1220188 RepID=A0A5M9MJL3_9EURO|nr:uncharacterized protein ATNIH1004_009370 [Aspergillus tanneri]KAA8645153.1 hypothetical protein ATNIH1004_009370 [Aspergillus tanneri]
MSSQANISPKQTLNPRLRYPSPPPQRQPTWSLSDSPLDPIGSETDGGSSILELTAPFVANYIGPAPPPGSSPHRYVFFLYEQPDGFNEQKYAPRNGQNLGNMHRMRYDLDAWEEEVKLGPVLAMNYFMSN